MRIRHLSVAALAIVALSTTGCSNVFLSMDDSLGFKAHDGGTSANTYLEITAYQWQDNQAGEKVAGPWVWQVPVTDGGRT
ncbi:MAG: hypothetical protein QF739_11735, partial [Acidimicrobiales bacterium]|nr:hypothetical protein [Acidimicrobiales bacterium]